MLTVITGSLSMTSARIWRQSALFAPPPETRAWVIWPRRTASSAPSVAQPEGDALQHGAGHVWPCVTEREPHEACVHQWVRVRRTFAGEVGQEEQALCACRDRGGIPRSTRQRRGPGRACRGTTAGCQQPRTSRPSGATCPARSGKACRRPSGSIKGPPVEAKTTPEVPSTRLTMPSSTAPTPTAPAA